MAKRRLQGHIAHRAQWGTGITVAAPLCAPLSMARTTVVETAPARESDATDLFLRRALDSVLQLALASTVASSAACTEAVEDPTGADSSGAEAVEDPTGADSSGGEAAGDTEDEASSGTGQSADGNPTTRDTSPGGDDGASAGAGGTGSGSPGSGIIPESAVGDAGIDPGGTDTVGTDTGGTDTGGTDTGGTDTGGTDTGGTDTGGTDTGGTDTGGTDTGGTDTGGTDTGGTDTGGEEFAALVCLEGSYFPNLAPGLTPDSPVDHVSIRENWEFNEAPNTLDSSGEACATASDAGACQAAVSDTSELPITFCEQICASRYLVSQQADLVLRWDTREKVVEFLGTIDAPAEAVLLAWYDGYNVRCDTLTDSAVRAVDDGFEVLATRMTADCAPIEVSRFLLHVSPDGTIRQINSEVISTEPDACVGRRPAGLKPSRMPHGPGALARFLAASAHLEGAAVKAFERMADELKQHGAPARLIARALEAAEDERRHARMVARLAEQRGASVPAVETGPVVARSLEAMALENVTEGCVRETYGALVGAYQAREANDHGIATVMGSIAPDELRHASLSWQVHAWLRTRLDAEARARVETAREQALCALQRELAQRVELDLTDTAGMPGPDQARALLEALEVHALQLLSNPVLN